MSDPNTEHGLRVQLATALLERDEQKARAEAAEKDRDAWLEKYQQRFREAEAALAAARRECAEQCEAKDAAYELIYRTRDLLNDCDDALARVQGHGCPPSDDSVASLRNKIRAVLAPPAAGEEGKR